MSGEQIGSFAKVKDRRDIVDLWVETPAGKVHAVREFGVDPVSYDFFIHVISEDGSTQKQWKLVTTYPGRKITRYVLPDGSSRTETEHVN